MSTITADCDVDARQTVKPAREDSLTLDDATLLARYGRTRDPRLRDRLVLSHRNLVRYLAGKFASRGEPLEDLIQVGTIGLINAIDRFDSSRGLKFATFATPTIIGEIRRYFRDKAWRLKVPRRLQDLNQVAAKAQEALSSRLGRPPTVQEVALAIGASEEETLEAMELGNAYDTISLDSQMPNDGEAAPMALADFLGAEDDAIEALSSYCDLDEALDSLDTREKTIIVCRFLNNMSQTEVAKRLNISQMHVSRLQKRALRKLRAYMNAATRREDAPRMG
jgi:RNA polymerase sigma-B factor